MTAVDFSKGHDVRDENNLSYSGRIQRAITTVMRGPAPRPQGAGSNVRYSTNERAVFRLD
jgi:hypothetical protein